MTMIIPKRKKVGDLMPTAYTGSGLFSALNCPIWQYDFDPKQLDIFFISNYGEKWASPYLDHISGGEILTAEKISEIANTIYSIYKSQWEHLYKAYKAEYNPIHNTDATEIETISKVGNETAQQSGSSESSESSSSSSETSGGGTFDNKRAGFNSSQNVNDTSGSNTNTAESDVSNSSSAEIESSASNVVNNTEDTERRHHKFGNIGVMTSAQLIGGEIELWRWNFIKGVMQDISDTIALSIY